MKSAAIKRALSPVVRAYALVNDPSTDSIISWSENGKSFIIRKPEELCGDVLVRSMGYSLFSSFLSSLRIMGIKKVEGSDVEHEYGDEYFVRDKPELIDNIYERITTGYDLLCEQMFGKYIPKQKELKTKIVKKKKKKKIVKKLANQLQQDLEI